MKILVALDASPVSLRAAREAGRLFPDAEFLVVNVTRRVVPWIAESEFGTVYAASLTAFEQGLDSEEVAAAAAAAGLQDIDALRLQGDPADAICVAADAHDVDAVVVGSHDYGVLRRLFDPSVAQAVVRGTYRPVLVVSGTAPASPTPGLSTP
jgi:nucleotide-binding universal stress UspA family protein